MNKSYIYLLLLAVVLGAQQASQGSEGYYLSPRGMTRQREVHNALEKVVPRIIVDRTTYNHLGATYVADNFTLKVSYNDGRQNIEIIQELAITTGGKFEFEYLFNYSKTQNGSTISGFAKGSVISDPFNYTKMLSFSKEGWLVWNLISGPKAVSNLSISNRMKIKRMEPYNEKDQMVLQDLLDRAEIEIVPSTVQSQILQKFNSITPMILNTTTQPYILNQQIDYAFHHLVKGQLNMQISRKLYNFVINPIDGYSVVFLTEIKGWLEPVCDNFTVPYNHFNFDLYGDSQVIHLNCLYQEIVEFIQSKGWLDTRLDASWNCNAFQFYAGDLYDIIDNLSSATAPRELVDGECKASRDRLKIKHSKSYHNILQLDVTYSCRAQTRDRNHKYIDILNFTADVKFLIEPKAEKVSLDFSIYGAEVLKMDFKPVGSYSVENIKLALFKANEVLKKLRGMRTFGSGFPSLFRQMPVTEVTQNYTIYFDHSRSEVPSKVRETQL